MSDQQSRVGLVENCSNRGRPGWVCQYGVDDCDCADAEDPEQLADIAAAEAEELANAR